MKKYSCDGGCSGYCTFNNRCPIWIVIFNFLGHKVFSPTGTGVLFGKTELLEAMPPYQGGGEMISSVKFEKTTYNEIPYKFEAGTPNIADVIGLGAGLNYFSGIDQAGAQAHEQALLKYASKIVSYRRSTTDRNCKRKVNCCFICH
jgi:selenocysteine lyase/cysteine desulfurase